MSYVALVTDAYDAMIAFYGETLGAPTVEEWTRTAGRGRRVDLHGMLVEILDNRRQRTPAALGGKSARAHLVVEVPDVAAARSRLSIATPEPVVTSWGATLFELCDPDGTSITYLQWLEPRP